MHQNNIANVDDLPLYTQDLLLYHTLIQYSTLAMYVNGRKLLHVLILNNIPNIYMWNSWDVVTFDNKIFQFNSLYWHHHVGIGQNEIKWQTKEYYIVLLKIKHLIEDLFHLYFFNTSSVTLLKLLLYTRAP